MADDVTCTYKLLGTGVPRLIDQVDNRGHVSCFFVFTFGFWMGCKVSFFFYLLFLVQYIYIYIYMILRTEGTARIHGSVVSVCTYDVDRCMRKSAAGTSSKYMAGTKPKQSSREILYIIIYIERPSLPF